MATVAAGAAAAGSSMSWLGPAIAGGASLLGGMRSNKSSAKEAEKNRQFQAEQSATSYQRGVADMKKAGINPMLSSKVGGASTPAGSTASQSDPITPAVSSAVHAREVAAGLEKLQAETDLTRENERSVRLKNDTFDRVMANLEADTGLKMSSAKAADATVERVGYEIQDVLSRIKERDVSMDEKRQTISESIARIGAMEVTNDEKRELMKKLRAETQRLGVMTASDMFHLGLDKEFSEQDRRLKQRTSDIDLRNKGVDFSRNDRAERLRRQAGTLDLIREVFRSLKGGE